MPFSFEATRDLWQYLGEFDALSEINELAVRDLLYRYDRTQRMAGKVRATTFINAKSKQHGIYVNASMVTRLSVGMAQHYLCTVWNCADTFLKQLRSEHQSITGVTWNGDSRDKGRLRLTLENLYGTESKGITAIGPERRELLEHCRIVRNRIVHPRSTNEEAVEDAYNRLSPHRAKLEAEYRIAPSRMASLAFPDAVLLSRVVKDVAQVLNDRARPEPQHLLKAIDPNALRKLKNNESRKRSAMIGMLCTQFGISQSEASAIIDAGSLA